MKRINHRNYICIALLIGIVLWSVFLCRDSYVRLFYSSIDFGLGMVYAIFFMYDWCPVPAVNEIKGVNVESHFPRSWLTLSEDFDVFIKTFFSKDNFINYMIEINPKITLYTRCLCFLRSLWLLI